MPTRNVTLAISPEAHLKARLWAAHHDVSLSALISTLLEGLSSNPNAEVPPPVSTSNVQIRPPPHPHPLFHPCETVKPDDAAR